MKIPMTPDRVLGAYNAARELSKIALPYKAARSVAQLKKLLEEEFHIVLNMEDAMLSEFGGKKNPDGTFRFPDSEAAEAFLKKYNTAMEEPAEMEFNRVDLSRYANIIKISAASIEALEGIVLFEEKSDG